MRRVFPFLFILLLLVGCWVFLTRLDRRNSAGGGDAIGTNSAADQDQGSVIGSASELARQLLASNAGLGMPQSKESAYREGLQSLNHVPIEYYGVVVDETGSPLPATTVKWSLAYNSGTGSGHKSGFTVTDSRGRFSINGLRGKALSVIPERLGYRFVATNGGAIYSLLWPIERRHIADPNRPTSLIMHRLRGGEPLIRVNKTFRFWTTNGPVRIDLARGVIASEGGDLLVTVNRPQRVLSVKQRDTWSVELASVGGEIQKADGLALPWVFEAPTNGYQKKLTMGMLPEDREWSTSITGGAFIRSRDGQVHCKFSFAIVIDEHPDKPAGVELRSLANTNSSRNWEEDPNQVTIIR